MRLSSLSISLKGETTMEKRAKRTNELWISEQQSDDMILSLRASAVLLNEKSPYQDILLAETKEYGRMMLLDGAIQITERDEFCYSEMMAHVALCSHPDPKRVLIVGGGDGAVLREVLRHGGVEKATLIDIDCSVIEASRRFLPTISVSLDDPRADVQCLDAMEYVRNCRGEFDVAIVDSTDPVDFAAGLYTSPFYRDIFSALGDNGMMIAQTESPFTDTTVMQGAFSAMKAVFPITRLYWGAMPTYPSGMWTYTVGSKSQDPSLPVRGAPAGTRYYSSEIHKGAFALPPFLADLLHRPTGL